MCNKEKKNAIVAVHFHLKTIIENIKKKIIPTFPRKLIKYPTQPCLATHTLK